MKRFYLSLGVAAAMILALPGTVFSQSDRTSTQAGTVMGTATDANGGPVPNAAVVLKEVDGDDPLSIVTPENGFFEFHAVKSGVPYQLSINATGFAGWVSAPITLTPGQFKIVTGIQLRLEIERTMVEVHYDPVEVATEQLKIEESQRVFGIIPNFYVTYESDPAPLTTKMKFKLALKVSTDPVTAAGVFVVAGARQAANSPHYGQGWDAYGERFGATAADGVIDIMIGGAILASVLHQDPRYFYQGTGTNGSRIRHAMFSPFVARGDGGRWQPNYSSLGGDLASSALSNLYYPSSDRGVGLLFANFAIGTAERVGASLAQEFLVGRFTRRGGHMGGSR